MADSTARRYLSLGIDVTGLRCLVVGGGAVGYRKAVTLHEAGAHVVLVAPEIGAGVQQLVQQGRVTWRAERYAPPHLDGAFLVVAATSDRGLNLQIAQQAAGQGVLCCIAAPAKDSRVIFPAVFDDGAVSVAVHSHGRDCRRSQRVRDHVAQALREESEPDGP